MLEHYTQHFDTVELNNSFYKLPAKSSLADWRESTPSEFHFAVKGSRFLTHMKKLKDAESGLERFLDAIDVLGPKLGPVLFQLPPNWDIDLERLHGFLNLLPHKRRWAFEFRNPTWNTNEMYKLLTRFNVAYCIFDLAGFMSPIEITADFCYVRLHGPGGKYQGSYSDETLRQWAGRIRKWRESLRAVYVYFDNDDSGYAPKNALQLKMFVQNSRQVKR